MTRNVLIGVLGAAALGTTAALSAGALPAVAAPGSAATVSSATGGNGDAGPGVLNLFSPGDPHATGELPSPPKPPAGAPTMPSGYQPPTAINSTQSTALKPASGLPGAGRALTTNDAAAATPAQAKTWGADGAATTLVLYDTTNTYGWLGELYAIGAGNLATHFGKVTAEPVADYQAGQVNDYTATIYLGSTYNEPIPQAFLNDVLTTTHPVVWSGDNVWQLSGTEGSAADTAFESVYGWDPSTSYFDTADPVTSVTYKGTTFTRSAANGGGILAPHITNQSQVQTLASAVCPSACNEIAQTSGNTFPWAIQSGNLTYVGEIPFSYMTLTDRYVAFADMLFGALDPNATPSHLALIRFEDIDPESSAANITAWAAYLKSQNVPFSMAVVPQYTDPNGYYNNGVPQTETLATSFSLDNALRTAISDGGTLVQHGYTHQYSNVDNPFTGVTGDDAEFYRMQCSTTATAPYDFQTPCASTDYVIDTGPLPGDSELGAVTRTLLGRTLFTTALLPTPTIWTTPQYVASAADYAGIDTLYQTRYEDELFFGGQLSGQPLDYSHVFGQFFPYEVHDLYGTTIIPENMGDYAPMAAYNNPARSAQDLINEGQLNMTVTQGVASFYLHPDYDPIAVLEQVVSGLKALGYTFVSPQGLLDQNG